MSYYDLKNATITNQGLTDVFMVHCHATSADCTNAANWAAGGETRITPTSFDMTTAPNAEGLFTGDYEGLTASGTTFDPFSVLAQPVATAGKTDPFANTAG